jgi:hypothetical protein
MSPATGHLPRQAHVMSRIHGLLAVQSLVIVLLTINRLSTLTLGYVLPNEFLRWVDLNNMLLLPLASTVAFWLLKVHLERSSGVESSGLGTALDVAFVVGVYLMAAGYGDHEVTNYLNTRFCLSQPLDETLCRIVAFNDDEFSHWVFFAGFSLINTAMMLLAVVYPVAAALSPRDLGLLAANGLVIGLGLFANLAFEDIGIDLFVVALLAAVAVALLRRHGRQPVVVYYSVAYVFGLVATAIVKLTG